MVMKYHHLGIDGCCLRVDEVSSDAYLQSKVVLVLFYCFCRKHDDSATPLIYFHGNLRGTPPMQPPRNEALFRDTIGFPRPY